MDGSTEENNAAALSQILKELQGLQLDLNAVQKVLNKKPANITEDIPATSVKQQPQNNKTQADDSDTKSTLQPKQPLMQPLEQAAVKQPPINQKLLDVVETTQFAEKTSADKLPNDLQQQEIFYKNTEELPASSNLPGVAEINRPSNPPAENKTLSVAEINKPSNPPAENKTLSVAEINKPSNPPAENKTYSQSIDQKNTTPTKNELGFKEQIQKLFTTNQQILDSTNTEQSTIPSQQKQMKGQETPQFNSSKSEQSVNRVTQNKATPQPQPTQINVNVAKIDTPPNLIDDFLAEPTITVPSNNIIDKNIEPITPPDLQAMAANESLAQLTNLFTSKEELDTTRQPVENNASLPVVESKKTQQSSAVLQEQNNFVTESTQAKQSQKPGLEPPMPEIQSELPVSSISKLQIVNDKDLQPVAPSKTTSLVNIEQTLFTVVGMLKKNTTDMLAQMTSLNTVANEILRTLPSLVSKPAAGTNSAQYARQAEAINTGKINEFRELVSKTFAPTRGDNRINMS